MKRLGKSILILMLTMIMVLGSCMPVFATGSGGATSVDANTGYKNLLSQWVAQLSVTDAINQKVYDYTNKQYKRSGGGYYGYMDLVNTSEAGQIVQGTIPPFLDGRLEELTSKAKQDFLNDVMTRCYIAIDNDSLTHQGITDETVTQFTEVLQQQTGLGSALLASLLQSTKPDYVTANRIWAPFSGPVGVVLGLLSIAVMALLGVTMAIDICYITIPAVQMALSGGEAGGNGQGDKPKGLSGLVSIEAKKAVDIAANGGGNGQGGSGEHKAAIGQYFKFRWKGLVMLVICLLYLVQGEIYSFIGMFIDLFSGFIG